MLSLNIHSYTYWRNCFIETKIIHIDEPKSKIETETIISDSLGILGKDGITCNCDMNMINQNPR